MRVKEITKKTDQKVEPINKEYRDNNLISEVESLANDILNEKKSNAYRDHFFPRMCKDLGFEYGAEIGVDKGSFSHHLLSKSDLKMMYCIDPWIDDFGSGHQEGYFDPSGNTRKSQCEETLREFVDTSRVELVQATGLRASEEFPENSLDYVYIDGDHSLEGIFQDIYAWTPKVRVGGIVSGHDYKDGPKSGMKDSWGGHLDYKVKTVCDYYCARYGYKLNVVGGRIKSWWFVKI